MLEELGIPYELARLDPKKGENRTPEYLKLNPMGHVPTLVDGDHALFESAAICMHLADQHPDKGLAPKPGSRERALYYQWIFFGMTELEPALVQVMMHTMFLPEAQRDPKQAQDAKERYAKAAKAIDEHLLTHTNMCGADFTVADIVITSIFAWANFLDLVDERLPNVGAYMQRNLDRPAARRALSG